MAKLLLCLFSIVTMGCSQNYWRADPSKWNIDSPLDLMFDINDKITYKIDLNHIWQSPGYTEFEKTGDCEDMCILFMYILKQLGADSELIVVYNLKNNFKKHAVVYCNGVIYDITRNLYFDTVSEKHNLFTQNYKIIDTLSFRQTMRKISKSTN